MSVRGRSRLLLFALLPMFTYLGHWSIPEAIPHISHAHLHAEAVQTESEHQHHAEHCHGDASSCSDMPYSGSATVVFLGIAIADLAANADSWRLDLAGVPALIGRSANPDVPPPRA